MSKYEGYRPHNDEQFNQMVKFFGRAKSSNDLDQIMMLFLLDTAFDREDILVAHQNALEGLKL